MDNSDAGVSSQQGKSFATNEAVQSLRKALQRLPGRTKMANIRLMYGRIEACLRSGIRLAEVAAVLADEHDIVISASTLQSSLSRIRKERGIDRESVKSRNNFGASLVGELPIRKVADLVSHTLQFKILVWEGISTGGIELPQLARLSGFFQIIRGPNKMGSSHSSG